MDDPHYIDDDYDDYDDCSEADEMNQGYPIEGTEVTPEIFQTMDGWNEKMGGIAYTILMRNADDSLTLHVRSRIPCYGELRKYTSTHGDEATQPEDRPGDLYYPFPTGTPIAVGVKLDQRSGKQYSGMSETIARMLKNDSPWRRGFGSEDDVIQTEHGLVFKNTDIDPTILVHMLKVIQHFKTSNKNINYYVGDLSDLGDFANIFLSTFIHPYTKTSMSTQCDSYVWNAGFDGGRYLSGNPHDLTGGTFVNRFDYSRKYLQDIFKGDFNFMKSLSKTGIVSGMQIKFNSPEEMRQAIRKAWAECVACQTEEIKVA